MSALSISISSQTRPGTNARLPGNMSFNYISDDLAELDVARPSRSSIASSTHDSENNGLSFWDPTFPISLATSPTTSNRRTANSIDANNSVVLYPYPPVTISFYQRNQRINLRYSRIELCKTPANELRCIELGSATPSVTVSTFVHTFVNSSRPIPHIEQPYIASEPQPLAISFLGDQTVQVGNTSLRAQPTYTFQRHVDCLAFQAALFGQEVLFIGGLAEAKSKGRGEECISQNLRILKSRSGVSSIVFFANSQRKENKRYVSFSIDAVNQVEQSKKSGRPITLKLFSSNDLLASLRSLTLQFLDPEDQRRFSDLLKDHRVKFSVK